MLKLRSRKVAVLTAAFTTCAVAGAFFAGEVLFAGEASNKVGNGSATLQALTASFPAGITPGPGGEKQLIITTQNTLGHEVTVHKLEYAITNSKEGSGCLNTWFSVIGKTKASQELITGVGAGFPVPIGEAELEGSYAVGMVESGTPQESCESATLKVALKVHT